MLALAAPVLGQAVQQTSQPNDAHHGDTSVRYVLRFPERHQHYVEIQLEFVPTPTGAIELFLPVWTPGSYLVREYARHLDSMSATNSAGLPLEIRKRSKNTWQVLGDIERNQAIRIQYRLYCNELSVRTNFIDREFALLNGAATFITPKGQPTRPHMVQLELPGDWKHSISSMDRPVSGPAHSFQASSYDELVDSPILAGNPSIHPFRVGDTEHYLVNQGGDGFWNGEEAAADVAKVVAEHHAMWQQVPYPRYFFINVIAESRGGLEHDNSTVMLTSRWNFRNQKNYKRWLSLVSHEFFHAWNVRRLRPLAFATYAYDTEEYLDELWVAEGVTSYYEDLALVRSGVISQAEYLQSLSREITNLHKTPGRQIQSLVESSHDSWIKYYRPDENSSNTRVSYYNKGAVVAFLLDIEVRRLTDNSRSLDDVMRMLYQKHAGRLGYTNQDVLETVNQVTSGDFEDWFTHALHSTDDLVYQEAWDWLGLENQLESPVANQESTTSNALPEDAWLGVSTEITDGSLVVTRVPTNSPAFSAGLNVQDEIIGIDGFRVRGSLSNRLQQYHSGDAVRIQIARRERLLELEAILGVQPRTEWKLQMVSKATPKQKANLRHWLHIEAPSAELEAELGLGEQP